MIVRKKVSKKTNNADAEDTSIKKTQPNSGTSNVAPFDVSSVSISSSSGFLVNERTRLDSLTFKSFSG